MEKEEELFFVEIESPVDVKRHVLEAQKDIVEGLKKYENVKLLRAKKIKDLNRLRSVIKELLKLISDLKSALPQTKIKEAAVKKKAEVVEEGVGKKKAKEAEKVEKPRGMSELEKLEAELDAIESKLSSLK